MVSNEKPYAVVRFVENDTFSEVPTNWLYEEKDKILCWWPIKVKSITSYISNCILPDETTWELCEVEIESYCDSWEKARKIADDPTYKTTDDEVLGKGRRTKFNKTRYSSSPEVSTKKNDNTKSNKTKKNDEYSKPTVTSCITLPPTFTSNDFMDDNIILDANLSVIEATRTSNSMPITYVNKPDGNIEMLQIAQDIIIIKEQCTSICRMHASLLLKFKSIDERLHKMERKSGIPHEGMRYQLLNPLLPLKDLRNLTTLEELITTNDSALSQYRNFIANIEGHTAKDNIHRILRKIFSDECAKLCSWKGKKNNYAVHDLRIIIEINDAVASSYELFKEMEFEDIAAEWFRFAKQRAVRKNKE